MDPNQTLRDAIGAFADGNKDRAKRSLDSLQTWLTCGGFAPDWAKAGAYLKELGVKPGAFGKLHSLAKRVQAEAQS